MKKKNNNSENEKALNESELDEVSGGSNTPPKGKLPPAVAYGVLLPKLPKLPTQTTDKGKSPILMKYGVPPIKPIPKLDKDSKKDTSDKLE